MTPVRIDVGLYPHQVPVFQWRPEQVNVYVKGRRCGGTHGAAKTAVRWALQSPLDHPLRQLWVDLRHSNINKYIKRFFLPPLKAMGSDSFRANMQDLTIELRNGASIDFGSLEQAHNLEGFGYDVAWINEAGHVLRDETFVWQTIMPMMIEGAGGKIFCIGAPKGSGGLFEQWYEKGQQHESGYWSLRHTSFDNPFLNRTVIERAARDMPAALYRQEFLAEFVGDGAFFARIDEAFRGEPQMTGEPTVSYVIGLDLAREQDWTAAWVGRRDQRRGVYAERYTRMPWPAQVERIARLARQFNGAHVIADATGLGGLFAVDDLRAAGVSVEPFTFTSDAKAEIMNNLAIDLEQGRLTLPAKSGNVEDTTASELRAYQRTWTRAGKPQFSAPPGMHDDMVCALALMVHGFGLPAGVFEPFASAGIGARIAEEVW